MVLVVMAILCNDSYNVCGNSINRILFGGYFFVLGSDHLVVLILWPSTGSVYIQAMYILFAVPF